jgi:prenyltransferase/squalene oxidase-like repeat protein
MGARNPDGGFGPRPGGPSEPEPTALGALALDNADARGWLMAHQRPDGGFGVAEGWVVDDAATALAALALTGAARERALDHVEATPARRVDNSSAIPHNPDAIGWAWTMGTFGWVDPTARALLALRIGRPASGSILDAIALLRDRESVGGGWNYGNRTVLGEDLPPYAQTTAMGLLALRGLDDGLESRALERLRDLWGDEQAGGLSIALALAAFRVHGVDKEVDATRSALDDVVDRTGLLGDSVALAWAALAAGDRVSLLVAP